MSGSVRKRGTTWQVRVYAGLDPDTGAKVWLTGTAPTRKAAGELGTDLLRDYRPDAKAMKELTFKQLVEEWWTIASPNLAPSTQRSEGDYLDRYILGRGLDRTLVAELTARQLDAHYRRLTADGLAPSTVRRVHGIIRRALQQAVRWEAVHRNVATSASPPRVQASKPTAPELADLRTLLAWLDANPKTHGRLRAMAHLAASTGARPGELCGLRWTRVAADAVTFAATVARGPDGETAERSTTKTGHDRVVPIDAGTALVLRDWRKTAVERALAAGRPLPDHVFPADDGTAWRPDAAARALTHAASAAKVKISWYGIRHLVATRLVAAGEDPRSIADRLGHDPAVLLKVYAASVPARGVELAERMAAELRG